MILHLIILSEHQQSLLNKQIGAGVKNVSVSLMAASHQARAQPEERMITRRVATIALMCEAIIPNALDI